MRYRHILIATMLSVGSLTSTGITPSAPGADNYFTRAENMYDTGNYAGVIDQLCRYLDIASTQLNEHQSLSEQAEVLMCRARLARSEFQAARALSRQFIRTHSGSPLLPMALLVEAESYFYEADYRQAKAIYETLPITTFDSAIGDEAQLHYAVSLTELGYFSEAEKILRPLLKSGGVSRQAAFYLAYLDYVQGNTDTALRAFRALDPDVAYDYGADFFIAQLLFTQGQYGEVLAMQPALLRAATSLERTENTHQAEARRILGESHYSLGHTSQAVGELTAYTELAKESSAPSARYILGVIAYENGNYTEAEEWLTPVASQENELGQSAALYLGQSAARRADNTSAAIWFDRAAHQPYDARVAETALYDYAAAVAGGGRVPFGSASSLLEEFGRTYPNSQYTAAVDEYLAKGYMAEKRWLKALDKLERIKHPGAEVQLLTRQTLYELGISELNSGNPTQAEYYLRRAVTMSDRDDLASACRLWLAESLYSQKKYKDSAAAYKQYLSGASRTDGNRALGYYNMAYALYQAGEYKACRSALDEALKITGSGALSSNLRSDAMLRKADCDNYLGNVQAALAAYRQAADESEGTGTDYAALQAACMQGILGDEAAKKAGLEAMMRKWPDSPWAQQALYELSQACLSTGDFRGALQAQERLQKLAPDSQMLRESKLQMAEAYSQAGKETEAVSLFRQIISTWPSSSQALGACENLQTYYSARGELNDFLSFLSTIPGARMPEASEMDRLAYINATSALERDPNNTAPLEQYISTYPKGTYVPDVLLLAAQKYSESRNSDKALYNLEKLLTGYADSDAALPALLLKANILKNKGDNSEAANTYRTLLSRGGASYALQAYEGLMQTSATPQEAIAYADKYLSMGNLTDEERGDAISLKADALLRAGRSQEAITLLRTLTDDTHTPQGGAAAVKIARIYLESGNAKETEKQMLKFTDQGCDDLDQLALGYIVLADAYAAQGDKSRALQYLESLSENYPGDNAEILTLISNGIQTLRQ